jgi:hypothetical protein
MFPLAGIADAQGVGSAPALDANSARLLRTMYVENLDTVHAKLVALGAAIPDDKFGWRPSPEVRTVGNVLLHVAMEWYYVLPASVGGKVTTEWPSFVDARAKLFAIREKKDILDQLERAWTYGRTQVASASDAQLLNVRADSVLRAAGLPIPANAGPMPLPAAVFWLTGDQHEHLGQLIAYARSVGVTPPWSK